MVKTPHFQCGGCNPQLGNKDPICYMAWPKKKVPRATEYSYVTLIPPWQAGCWTSSREIRRLQLSIWRDCARGRRLGNRSEERRVRDGAGTDHTGPGRSLQ